MNRVNRKLAKAGMVIGFIGLGVLLFVDWRIAVGVFICLYGNNMDRSARRNMGEQL